MQDAGEGDGAGQRPETHAQAVFTRPFRPPRTSVRPNVGYILPFSLARSPERRVRQVGSYTRLNSLTTDTNGVSGTFLLSSVRFEIGAKPRVKLHRNVCECLTDRLRVLVS
jgi:hypothetical protein